jgi:L-lactate dehydrogenase
MTSKVVVVGAGSVGATYAYAMLQNGVAREIVLLDMDRERALGEVMDLQQGVSFTGPVDIKVGTYADCAEADLVVVTAGAKQKPGETRLDLTKRNTGIVGGIIGDIMAHHFSGILLMVSNPVDVLTQVAWKVSGLPRRQVLGSGTVLDSARLRSLISGHCGVDPRSVHAYVIGEHGDSEVAAWSSASIGGMPLATYCEQCKTCVPTSRYPVLMEQVKRAAYEIISRKGATFYAIGLALVQITNAILRDEHRVLPVSTVLENFHGIQDIALSLPAVVGRQGVERVLDIPLAPEELKALQDSAQVIKENLAGAK